MLQLHLTLSTFTRDMLNVVINLKILQLHFKNLKYLSLTYKFLLKGALKGALERALWPNVTFWFTSKSTRLHSNGPWMKFGMNLTKMEKDNSIKTSQRSSLKSSRYSSKKIDKKITTNLNLSLCLNNLMKTRTAL